MKHKDRLNPVLNFESFVTGVSNELAYSAAKQIAKNPGHAYNPLLFYGGIGLGKTHLLHAVGNLVQEQNLSTRIFYVNSERFIIEMIHALRHGAIHTFTKHYRSANVLLIDDIQLFANKKSSQEEFFRIFNELLGSNQQIVMTCDQYPKEVEGLEMRLRSRFGWGLTVAIEPPDFETRVNVLKRKAFHLGWSIPEDIAVFIAGKVDSNVPELHGILNILLAESRFRSEILTSELVCQIMKKHRLIGEDE